LTTSLNSQWWEFTVASYNGHLWNKHCTGEIMALSVTQLGPAQEFKVLPRKLVARKWYESMRKGGLELGPCFQTLQAIETSTNMENQATGSVSHGENGDEANYHVHPTVIDGTLQLLGAAAVNGHARKVKNWLPTSIDKISVIRCSSDMTSRVSATVTSNSSVVGEGSCISGGIAVIEASGIRMALAESSLSSDMLDTHATARHTWSSDIDFMDIQDLIRPVIVHTSYLILLGELAQLCLLSSQNLFSGLEIKSEHMKKYASWVDSQAQRINSSGVMDLKDDTISAKIESLVRRLSGTPATAAAAALQQVCTKMDLLASGQNLESVLSDDQIMELYKAIDHMDRSNFIRILGHSKPNIRVLEIGVGRGSLVNEIVKDLTLPEGQILCSKYTLTTKGFISEKGPVGQPKVFPNMEHVTLDVSKDLVEQGFEDRQYDLIIATNALHGTKFLQESLVNIRKLLCPDGRLLLQELCPESKWVNFIFGVQPSWWCGDADGRPDEPYVDTKRWETELLAAGFGGIEGVVFDLPEPHQVTATMVARPASSKKASKRVTILCGDQRNDADEIVDCLKKAGYEITKCKINDSPPPGQDVISLLDREGPFFEKIDSARFQALGDLLRNLRDSGILWLTPLSQIGCRDPRYAQVIGFARTMRSEMLIDFATCEISSFNSPEKIVEVLAKFQVREDQDLLKSDFEYVIRDGEVKVGRFYPFALRGELLTSDQNDRAILDVGTPGRINTLQWFRQPREELQSDDVEIEV
jgi:SAM-dependent methyltransferase